MESLVQQDLMRATQRRVGRGLLVALALAAACNIAGLAVPLYNMELYNRVLTSRSVGTLVALSAGLALAGLVYAALEYLHALVYLALGGILERSLGLPALLVAATKVTHRPSAAAQAVRDLTTLRLFVTGPLLATPLDLMWSPLYFVVLFLMHWSYGVFAVTTALVLAGLNLLTDWLTRSTLIDASDAAARALNEIASTLRRAEAVIGLGMVPAVARRWQHSQSGMLARLYAGTRASKAISAAVRALRLLMTGGMVALGLVVALKGEASAGSLLAANLILARMLMPFEQLVASWRAWMTAAAAWRRLAEVLEGGGTRRETRAMPCPNGRLLVDRLVYFPRGVDNPVLRGVSFAVEPGEALGIVGASGGGKSTLARAVLGILEPTSGGAYLDGNSTYLWEREDFGRHVGYAPQSVSLFDGTVAENIARLREADPRDVIEAAKLVGMHETILRLPHGYATPVGDAGFLLSGGQRQLLTLARALFGRPKLIVLDEPNASLDGAGEEALVEAILAAKRRRASVILIAHRVTAISAVDKLLVLKDGFVDRFGAREAVMAELAAPPVRLVARRPPETRAVSVPA
jgi:ATP-binding cassette subfamily C protein